MDSYIKNLSNLFLTQVCIYLLIANFRAIKLQSYFHISVDLYTNPQKKIIKIKFKSTKLIS